MKANSYKYLKIVHIYRLYRDQSANVMRELFSRTKLSTTPFLHPKQKSVNQQIEILRFRNLFAELLDHLKIPQTELLPHVMLSLLTKTCSLQCLSHLFFFFFKFFFEECRSSETAHIKNRNTGCIPIGNYNDFRFFNVF